MNHPIAAYCTVIAIAACLRIRPMPRKIGGQTWSSLASTLVAETPQSIITSGDIVDFGLDNLNQALRYVARSTPEQRGAAAEVTTSSS